MAEQLRQAIPILRIFDLDKAREFYVGYLGFAWDWEHRFDPESPRYIQVSRDDVRLHLSEHHGDGTPGSALLVSIADARALHEELQGHDYPMMNPGIESEPWGLTVTVLDPFQNRITFHEPRAEELPDSLDPIRHTLTVAAAPARAFEVFTAGMGEWWDPVYTPEAASYAGIDVEPQVGGSVTLRHDDAEYPIGEVTVWEPGARFAQTFTLAIDEDSPTTLDVRFTADGDGTSVEFEHGGWVEANRHCRRRFADWSALLERYVEAARP
ncbi:glyoxalase superfamily protein [Nocardioides speluncae]|uniref:glyoxalase superfamily protein n=1 Tax=Nocardioides speluncae TaxID=2670337 RepID=UPI000D69E9D1|nr:glyoxalase superfamily protein [Nocardioides speluncae]